MEDINDDGSGDLPKDDPSQIMRSSRSEADWTKDGIIESKTRRPDLDDASKLAQEYANLPSQKLARELVLGLGPDITGAAATAKILADLQLLQPDPSLKEAIAALKPTLIDRGLLEMMGGITLPKIDPSVLTALQGIQPLKIDPALALAVKETHKALEEAMRPLGGVAEAFKAFEAQQRAVQHSLVASLGGPVGEIIRTGQWASTIGKFSAPDLTSLIGSDLGSAVAEMRAAISSNFMDVAGRDQREMSAMLGLNAPLEHQFTTTQLKMSVLAGIGETLEPLSNVHFEAYHSLFGDWRTRPDLPENFWRDGRVRKRMYREAEVDDGLIVASPGLALEVMIESGLTAGFRSENNAVAVVTLGEVSMTIRSHGTRRDAFAILERIEAELRNYISRKLQERFGPDWFKARASNLMGKAKDNRKAAMKRGEAFAPLINFIDLGELTGIILSTNNWDEIFGDVFVNRAEFDHDMQKLVAARRPTMHVRTVDGVRLVELICVVQRLSDQMADDGAWKGLAETDR